MSLNVRVEYETKPYPTQIWGLLRTYLGSILFIAAYRECAMYGMVFAIVILKLSPHRFVS